MEICDWDDWATRMGIFGQIPKHSTHRLVSLNTTVAYFISINMFCVFFFLWTKIFVSKRWIFTVDWPQFDGVSNNISREREKNSFGTLKDEKWKKILSFDGDVDKYHATSERQTEREWEEKDHHEKAILISNSIFSQAALYLRSLRSLVCFAFFFTSSLGAVAFLLLLFQNKYVI